MILKKIEIYGFKSFGKKTEIDFNEVVTGIVGPNGSGKSNVVDAVRWVLGEQRVKSLRGSKMEDVIFSGTEERKPLGYAQVVLYLDNSSHIFATDYEEISITRRLFRSGESEYYINKVQCRLKDIHALVMDTGLGREGYSIVSQGQIESIVNASAAERKLLIEEAVGIVKYKVRKLEAERKLERAQNNMYRVMDIIAELETRLPNLRRQSEKAEKFITYKNELKDIEVNIFVHRMDRLKEQASKSYFNKKALEESLSGIDTEIDTLDKSYNTLKTQVNSFDDEIAQMNEKIHSLITNFENSKTEISVARSKAETCEVSILETNKEIEQLKKEIETTEAQSEELNKTLEAVKDSYNRIKETYDVHKASADSIGKKYHDGDSYLSELREKVNALEEELDEKQKKINDLKAGMQNNQYLLKQLSTDIEDLQVVISETENNLAIEDSFNTELVKAKETLNVHQNNYQRLFDEYEDYKDSVQTLFTKMQTDEARLKLLVGYENNRQGYRYGIRKLMEYKVTNHISDKIFGTVGDLIKTDTKYTTAIGNALGGSINYVVVDNETTAKECIDTLKKNKWGRVTFLPKNVIKSYPLHKDSSLETMNGYIAVASDLVECDDRFNEVIKNLLGKVLVIDQIDNAIAIAKKTSHKYKLVTLDGEVFFPGGALVGGKTKQDDEGVLSRKNEIEKLEKSVEESKNQYEKLLGEKSVFAEKIKQEKTSITESQATYDILREENAVKVEQIRYKKDQIERAKELILKKETEKDNVFKRIDKNEKELIELNNTIIETQGSLVDMRNEMNKASSGGYKEDYVDAINLLNASEVELVKTHETTLQWQERLDNTMERLDGLNNQLLLKEETINKLTDDLDALRAQIEYCTELDRDYDATRKEADEKYDILVRQKKTVNEEYIRVNDAIIQLNKDRNAVTEQLNKVDVSIGKVELEMEHLQTGILEDYSLTYASALEHRTEIEDLEKSIETVTELKDKIRKLGNINVEALEEYKEVKERFDTMTKQKDDLNDAKDELTKVIKDISASMVHQFMQQFNLIQKEFNSVFKKLFDGGEARLVLTDPDDVMESGVDIVAQPPATKLKNIAALSGGEKSMTAVSLIFAILNIKPAPFCILDEIDAALDDANGVRFCEYLASIKHKNQFVIVTHKKKTMEIADALYGASMGREGITQIFSVKMNRETAKGEVNAG